MNRRCAWRASSKKCAIRPLKLRMVQIGPTFSRFQRIVRDVSREIGKEIRLEIGGAETELDKTLIESITDPLTHLVRNAIDHGIETAEVRRSRGKNVEGVVRLDAYHDSGSVVIEVADDGGGLKRERIVAKAIERGLITDGSSLTDTEAFSLIFEPGFSTAEQVTNLSGRGVGMDVVKRNVNALRGTVELDSKEGQGTTVRIRLPLTLAIIDGFLVGVGGSSFVIPLELVEECVELGDEHRAGGRRSALHQFARAVLPFVRLREMFAIRSSASRRESIVVIRSGGKRIGIVVDDLLGEMQAVIKPLSRLFSRIRGIGGSTILGTGQLALILDVPSLLDLCLNAVRSSLRPAAHSRNDTGGLMFRNLKIGVRLGLSFGLILMLLGAVTYIGIDGFKLMKVSTDDIVNNRVPKMELALELQRNAETLGLVARDQLLAADAKQLDKAVQQMQGVRERNGKIIDDADGDGDVRA